MQLLRTCFKCHSRIMIANKYDFSRLCRLSGKPFLPISNIGHYRFISSPGYLNLRSAFPQNSLVRNNSSSAPTTYVHSIYLDAKPVLFLQDLLIQVHDTTGLPWWSTIVISVVSLRLLTTFPLAIYQQYILAKYENLQPEIMQISQKLSVEVAQAAKNYNFNEAMANRLFRKYQKREINRLIIRDNCHPFKSSILIFVQIPLWISLSLCLRNLVQMLPHGDTTARIIFFQLTVGGTLWFANLTHPDVTFLLPALVGLVNLSLLEFHVMKLRGSPGKLQRLVTNLFRVLSVVMVPLAATLPSCLPLYWLTSCLFGLLQNIVICLPKVRRFLRIPKSPSESETPLRDIGLKIKQRLRIAK